MSIANLISRAADAGVFLFVEDQQLRFKLSVDEFPAALKEEIIANKAELIAAMSAGEALTDSQEIPAIERLPRNEDNFVLSHAQQRLWFIDKLAGGTAEYNMPTALEFEGQFDVAVAEQALNRIIARHEPLRTVYIETDDGPRQRICQDVAFTLDRHDFSQLADSEQQLAVSEQVAKLREHRFDLAHDLMVQGSYVLLAEGVNGAKTKGVLLLNIHHIASDGWSMGLLVREFVSQYQAITQGLADTLPPLDIQYVDYAKWQRNWLQGEVLEQQLNYWKQQLQDVPVVHSLPLDKPRPEVKQHQGGTVSGRLDAKVSQQLQKLAAQFEITPFMLLHGTLALVIAAHSNSEDIVIGTPVANRTNAALEPLIGLFVNTLVLRVNTAGSGQSQTLADYFRHIRQVNLDAQSHQDVPFDYLVEQCQVPRSIQHSPLFQILFNMNTNEAKELTLDGLQFKAIGSDAITAKFDLDIGAEMSDNGIYISWRYDLSIFDGRRIERMSQHLLNLLAAIGDAANQPQMVANANLASFALMSASETQQLTLERNDTTTAFDQSLLIHQLFERQADLTPDAVAIKFNDEMMSYAEVNMAANRLAHYLHQYCLDKHKTIAPDSLIGLCVAPGFNTIIGMLAILKSGAGYVPMDPAYPQARLHYMVQDAAIDLVVCDSDVASHKDKHNEKASLVWPHQVSLLSIQAIDDLTLASTNPAIDALAPHHLAYVIYTSGSTGQPKGVMIEHRQFVGRLSYFSQLIPLDIGDCVPSIASNAFDISLLELMYPLTCGAHVMMLSREVIQDANRLAHQLVDCRFIHMVPSLASVWLQAVIDNGLKAQYRQLKQLATGGDNVPRQLLQKLNQQFADVDFMQFYGPTETTLFAVCHANTREDFVSLGRVIENTSLYVVDKSLGLTPDMGVGELCIGGVGVARGYLNRAELTMERFIDNPFATGQQHSRLYRTGDLVRYLPDGNLMFMGRNDEQVKIRGFRIELGEINAAIEQLAMVQQAVVVVQQDADDKRLVAYVVAAGDNEFDDKQLTSKVRSELQTKLPAYMVPALFVPLTALPLNANGKVDLKALPAPDATSTADFVKAATEQERILVDVWAKLLKIDSDKLSVTANFFELGGDSILSIQAVSRSTAHGLHFSVKDLFTAQTIRQLAQLIQTNAARQSAAPRLVAAQEQVLGEMPLLPIQQHCLADSVDLHHDNQAVMLRVPDGFDLTVLRAMMSKILLRHDALRLVFSEDDDSWLADFQPFSPQLLDEVVGYEQLASGFAVSEALSTVTNNIQRSLAPTAGRLIRAVLLQDVDGERRLMVVIHHLVVDGVSWRILLSDFDNLFGQIQANHGAIAELSLPEKTHSYQQWGEYLSQLLCDNEQNIDAEYQYWQQNLMAADDAIRQHAQVIADGVESGRKQLGFSLSESITERLLGPANRAYRTRTNELLMASLLLAVNRWQGLNSIRFDLESHGREVEGCDLDVSQTVGWFTSVYPLTLSYELDCDDQDSRISDAICAAKEQYRAIPNHGIGFGLLQQLTEQTILPGSELVFNYLGQFDQVVNQDTHFGIASESTGSSRSSRRSKGHPLAISGKVFAGILSFQLSFEQSDYRIEAMQTLIDEMQLALEAIVEHCIDINQTGGRGRYTPSDFPLAQVNSELLQQWQHHEIEDIYPATGMQQGLLFHSLLQAGSYVSQTVFKFNQLDVERLQMAWQQVALRHEIFRTAFVGLDDNNAHQLVLAQAKLPWLVQDLSHLSASEQVKAIETIRIEDKTQGFAPEQAPLMRFTLLILADGLQQLIWSHHHALLDGWCLPMLFGEVTSCYHRLSLGNINEISKPSYRYRDYAMWLAAQDKQQARDFWTNQLKQFVAPTPLPLVYDDISKHQNAKRYSCQFLFDAQQTKALTDLAQRTRTTVNVIVQAAWALLLSRYSDESHVVFGAVTSGRPADLAGIEQIMGLFINSLPTVITLESDTTVADWLIQLHGQLVERESYSYLPLIEIQQLAPVNQALFDSLLVFENYPVNEDIADQIGEAELNVKDIQSFAGTNYGITLTAVLRQSMFIKFDVPETLLSAQQTQQIAEHFRHILESLACDEHQKVADVAMLPASEREQLLYQLNYRQNLNNTVSYPPTVHQWFEQQVELTPDAIAVSFDEVNLSFYQLNQQANRLAGFLQAQGVKANGLVGICLTRSIEMVVAVLGVLKSGVGYLPLDAQSPVARLSYQLQDAKVTLLLTSSVLAETLDQQLDLTHKLTQVALDSAAYEAAQAQYSDENPQIEVSRDDVAYVIYTSGSTGKPKGVMVSHGNVCHYLDHAMSQYGNDVSTAIVSSPLSFDATVTSLYLPLISGGCCQLLAEGDDMLERLAVILFEAEQPLLLKITPAHLQGLQPLLDGFDGEVAHQLVIGGEALDGQLLSQWQQYIFPQARYFNEYGPTEATVGCSIARYDEQRVFDIDNEQVTIGNAIANTSLYVLDNNRQLVAKGAIGELYIGGAGVALGYLYREALTQARFIASPFAIDANEKLYQTGDLVRYLANGELLFVGRRDEQVKIHGYRIELGEIEHQMMQFAGIEQAIAMVRQDDGNDGDKKLVGYYVALDHGQIDEQAFKQQLAQQLPSYMVPQALVAISQVPLTLNGKVDKQSLPAPDGSMQQGEYIPPNNETERALALIWQQILQLEEGTVSSSANFIALGGHSILVMKLLVEIRKQWTIDIDIKDIFDAPSLAQLAQRIDAGLTAQPSDRQIVPVTSVGEPVALSFAQQRLWFIDQLEGNSVQYNMPLQLKVEGTFDVDVAERTLQQVIVRHQSLRTVFEACEPQPVQRVLAEFDFKLKRVDLSNLAEIEQQQRLRDLADDDRLKPFNLTCDLMLRGCYIKLDKQTAVLLLNMHHIAVDGWSLAILLREFVSIYSDFSQQLPDSLPELAVQYADFAHWQRNWLTGEVLQQQLDYWQQQLVDIPAVHSLPLDRARPEVKSYRGGVVTGRLSASVNQRLQQLARDHEITPFMLIHGAIALLLSRHSNSQDIVLGTVVANRSQSEIEPLIGFFVNTLVLRVSTEYANLTDYLRHIRQVNLDAQAHQDIPFEYLVEHCQVNRSLQYSPLFQITFSMNTTGVANATSDNRIEGVNVTPLNLAGSGEELTTKFDLDISANTSENGLFLSWRYDSSIFNAATIDRLNQHLQQLLTAMVEQPQGLLSELDMLTANERERLLYQRNNTYFDHGTPQSADQLLCQHAALTPNKVALRFADDALSYQALDSKVNQMARHLQRQGVEDGSLVAVCLARDVDLMVTLLALFRLGAAYLPVSLSYPQQRVDFMLADAKVKHVVSNAMVNFVWPDDVNVMDIGVANLAQYSNLALQSLDLSQDRLAYVIYTSGSTGTPKGVKVGHHSLFNLLQSMARRPGFNRDDKLLAITPLIFDISALELFLPLACGGELVLAADNIGRDGEAIAELLQQHQISVLQATPSVYAVLMESGWQGKSDLKLLTGGENITAAMAQRLLNQCESLWNMYGPTETTIWSSCDEIVSQQGEVMVTIGQPIDNTQIYLVDSHLQPVPDGAIGEICIAGTGLAWGYLAREQLTAERFVKVAFTGDESRLYRTGDYGRYLADGRLQYVERIDDQVKIRGFRIELGEIETALCQNPDIESAVVLAQADNAGDMRLLAWVVSQGEQQELIETVLTDLQQQVPDYMVPASIMTITALPLTPSGKVDKKALLALDGTSVVEQLTEQIIEPNNDIERQVRGIWAQLLDCDEISLSVTSNFFTLGGHSLMAVRLVSQLRLVFEIELSVRDVFECPTIRTLAAKVQSGSSIALRSQVVAGVNYDSAELPLSFAQQRLWFIDQLAGGSPEYNMPVALNIKAQSEQHKFNLAAAEQAIQTIIARHQPLRTVYADSDNGGVQRVIEDVEFTLDVIDLTQQSAVQQQLRVNELATQDSQTAFDLTQDLLIRASFIVLSELEGVLLLNTHHIASDGWSMGLMVNEFALLYQAILAQQPHSLPPLELQYVDYALWQHQLTQQNGLTSQLDYWQKQLEDVPAVHGLPLDRPRPELKQYVADVVSGELSAPVSQGLLSLAKHHGITPFMLLHGALALVLARHSYRSDIVIGTPVANRMQAELEPVIGFFANTLVLRTSTDFSRLDDYLAHIRQVNLDAQTHQDVPFELLVEQCQVPRSRQHTPLFQILFTMNTNEVSRKQLEGLEVSPLAAQSPVAKFDLDISARLSESGGRFTWRYDSAIFDAASIERLNQHLTCVLTAMTDAALSSDVNPHQLQMLSDSEIADLIVAPQPAARMQQQPTLIHQQFEAQARLTPDAVALVLAGDNVRVSYGELNAKANQLAHYLRAVGVKNEMLVGLCFERSIDMIVAVLAVLKAGGGYLPLDPAHPIERSHDTLLDAKVSHLLTHQAVTDVGWPQSIDVIVLDAAHVSQKLAEQPSNAPVFADHQANQQSSNLAYVIYTSGSTGKPKGVMVEHQNVTRLFSTTNDSFGFGPTDVWCLYHSLAFDFSVWEIFGALLFGGQLVIPAKNTLTNAPKLVDLCIEQGVTVFNQTPGAFYNFMAAAIEQKAEFDQLRLVCFGGEALQPERLAPWWQAYGDAQPQLVNMYGITETTVHVTAKMLSQNIEGSSNIGKPLADLQVYLVDQHQQLVPRGCIGEMLVGGAGVSRGYLQRKQLTQQRFITASFTEHKDDILYRTGDLAYFDANGDLCFVGRMDNQVKIRGFRIEIPEIEHQLLSLDDVASAVVIVDEVKQSSDKRLVAYVVVEGSDGVDEQAIIADLKHQLSQRLPSYMVPAVIMLIEQIPLTLNGKVDKKTLPLADATLSQAQYVAPQSEQEALLVDVWSELLQLEPSSVSVTANFFELGGNSLLTFALKNAVNQYYPQAIRLEDIYQHQTIRDLAAVFGKAELSLAEQSLVWLTPQTGLDKLFVFHPYGGRVECYHDYAQLMQDMVDVIGIQAPCYYQHELRFDNLSQLAQFYVEGLTEVQPNGPYRLTGWSSGGELAYYVANELRKLGEEVAFLSIIDASIMVKPYQDDVIGGINKLCNIILDDNDLAETACIDTQAQRLQATELADFKDMAQNRLFLHAGIDFHCAARDEVSLNLATPMQVLFAGVSASQEYDLNKRQQIFSTQVTEPFDSYVIDGAHKDLMIGDCLQAVVEHHRQALNRFLK